MQRIGQNRGLCHGEQKANSYNSRKNSLKTFVVVVVVCILVSLHMHCLKYMYNSKLNELIAMIKA